LVPPKWQRPVVRHPLTPHSVASGLGYLVAARSTSSPEVFSYPAPLVCPLLPPPHEREETWDYVSAHLFFVLAAKRRPGRVACCNPTPSAQRAQSPQLQPFFSSEGHVGPSNSHIAHAEQTQSAPFSAPVLPPPVALSDLFPLIVYSKNRKKCVVTQLLYHRRILQNHARDGLCLGRGYRETATRSERGLVAGLLHRTHA
jgi:hypothetical protein